MVNKSELQKLYEKFAMIAQNPDKLGVMVAKEGSGQHRVVLTIAGEEEAQTPVATLLTKRDIRGLQPIFNPTLGEEFRANLELEDRASKDAFDAARVMVEFNEGLQPRHLT